MESKGNVLIADNDHLFLSLLSDILQDAGYRTRSAPDGKNAMAQIEQQPPDFLLVDLIMPEVSGEELIQHVKSHPRYKKIVIIIISGALPEYKQFESIGADYYIEKGNIARLRKELLTALASFQTKGTPPKAPKLDQQPLKSRRIVQELLENRGQYTREKKRAQQALRESERRFHTVLETTPEPILVGEIDGTVTYLNPAFSRVFGWTIDTFGADYPHNFMPSDMPNDHADLVARMVSGQHVEKQRSKRLNNSGDTVPVSISGAGIATKAGQTTGYVMIFRDRRRQKTLEDQLRQAQKMEAIGTLAGGIAHDFNNILYPIVGYTEMAIDELAGNQTVREYLEEVLKASSRAAALIQHILTFSRLNERKRRLLKIQTTINEALDLLRASLPSTIEIDRQVDATCSPILSDPAQIHQVVMNLCTNAYRAMQASGGKITVGLKEVEFMATENTPNHKMDPGIYLLFSVADTGHGMDNDTIERIFDPYFTTQDMSEGTGMGLAVVHGIIRNHEGHIAVTSTPGSGSRFDIYLPLLNSADDYSRTKPSIDLPQGQEHILLVDDEKQIAQMIEKMLTKLGYRVSAYTDSQQALNAFEKEPMQFGLVISDLTMPELTGDRLATELFAIRADIPIILCTGFSELITADEAKALGIRQLINKPVVMTQLAEVVRQVLDTN
jgi:PAS domain S-box-containing protein